MAKDTLNRKFTNCIIDLDNMIITEMPKKDDGEEVDYDIMTELAQFAGMDKRIDITIKEDSIHEPGEE